MWSSDLGACMEDLAMLIRKGAVARGEEGRSEQVDTHGCCRVGILGILVKHGLAKLISIQCGLRVVRQPPSRGKKPSTPLHELFERCGIKNTPYYLSTLRFLYN
jgi:hypothetical protein